MTGTCLESGYKKMIPPSYSAEKTIDEIHSQGGLAIAAHPYTFFHYSGLLRTLVGVGRLIHKLPFDGVEVKNANITEMVSNPIARFQARKLNVAKIGSSDSHFSTAYAAYTEFPGHTVNDLFNAIRRNETSAKGRVYLPHEMIPLFGDYERMRASGNHKNFGIIRGQKEAFLLELGARLYASIVGAPLQQIH